MQLLVKDNEPISRSEVHTPVQTHRDPIKQEIRRRIYEAIEVASDLKPKERIDEIRFRLFAIQNYCKTIGKTFIVVEQLITCDQFDLGGSARDTATLFRGPNEDASVAICVTHRGSILHRNDCAWKTYSNEGDIRSAMLCNSLEFLTLLP
jgi:hypothetical protein